MRICIDIDGVLCQLKQSGESYKDVRPIEGASATLHAMRQAGHTVILHTARHMKTCSGNVGLVLARQGQVTLQWLADHDMPYDEIHFGKPHADVYIDDNGYRFTSWSDVGRAGERLPVSKESAVEEGDK